MDDAKLAEKGLELCRSGRTEDFEAFKASIRSSHPVVYEFLRFYELFFLGRFVKALRIGLRLLPTLVGTSRLTYLAHIILSNVYRNLGEISLAETHALKALRIAEAIDERDALEVRFNLIFIDFLTGNYSKAHRALKELLGRAEGWLKDAASYLFGYSNLILRGPTEALAQEFHRLGSEAQHAKIACGALEVEGIIYRLLGAPEKAREAFLRSLECQLEMGSSYASVVAAKALELWRLGLVEKPPEAEVKAAAQLGQGGSQVERAAATEVYALLSEGDADVSQRIAEVAREFKQGFHLPDALLAAGVAAKMGWESRSPGFFSASSVLAELLPIHPGLSSDGVLGDFILSLKGFLEGLGKVKPGLAVKLIGVPEVSLGVRKLPLRWRNRKALLLFLYLLLTKNHRANVEHLLFLFWPDSSSRAPLHTAVSYIRSKLGSPGLLVKQGDYYEIREVWVDLAELEELLIRAEASPPEQRWVMLQKARQLARSEDLLEGFDDVPYVDEYRRRYRELLLKLDRLDKLNERPS